MELLLPKFGLFFWTLVAFLITFFLLKKFAWAPILSALNQREKGIATALESAEKVKTEMASMKAENENLLAKANEERAVLLKDARTTRDKMVSDAKEQAKTEANKIMLEAQQQIMAQKNAALTDVKNHVGKLVIEVSEKVLRRELTNKQNAESHIASLVGDIKMN